MSPLFRWLWLAAATGAAVLVGARVAAAAGVLVVVTPSVPEGLYLARPVDPAWVEPGAFVCLPATGPYAPAVLREDVEAGLLPRQWRSAPLLKRVAGVAGDRVEAREGRLWINGAELPNSTRRETDSRGRALPSPRLPVELPEGAVWLSSSHPEGYDSRYFGVVAVRALSCVARPVWTW